MAENETALVTELSFETDSVLNAALLIFNMTVEGQNNHKIISAEFSGIASLSVPVADQTIEGTVHFAVPDTSDLRLWVETKAAGIGARFELNFETVDLLNPTPLDPIPAVATA